MHVFCAYRRGSNLPTSFFFASPNNTNFTFTPEDLCVLDDTVVFYPDAASGESLRVYQVRVRSTVSTDTVRKFFAAAESGCVQF
jgi:hypothetical protein